MLTKEALRDAAVSIRDALQQQEDTFWLRVAQQCLYYGILYHPLQGAAAQTSTTISSSISSDELVRCWVAEGLDFSVLTTTRIPDTTNNNKQSNYRIAYEAGKVIIEALQEYSSLPNYSISTPTRTSRTTTTSASMDATTGVSLLARDVPRLKEDKLSDRDKSKWVSFMNDDGRHVSLNWRTGWERQEFSTTLILRGYSKISGFPFHIMLTPGLHVLDLSYTPIESLPSSFSHLLNLKLLSLRGCSKLKTLCSKLETLSQPSSTSEKETSSLAHLENLEVLDMNGVPLLKLTQQDGSKKSNLHYLDLSSSGMNNLPSEFFCDMSSLEELILGNCSHLEELPPSLAKLSNLLILHVEGTRIASFPEGTFEVMQRLHTLKLINNSLLMSLPTSLSKARGLKELHINNCNSLRLQLLWGLVSCLEDLYIQTWEALKDIKIHGHPNLRTFSLSGPWTRRLSLRGCSKLKIVNFSDDLKALEDVDLSGTAIEELPHNLPNLPQLRMLLILNVPGFKRFPWHQLFRFPKIFCLDHCAEDDNKFSKMFDQLENCADDYQSREQTTNSAQINITDSRIFYSFNMDAATKLVKEGQFLQSFSVQVKPCSKRGKEPQNKEIELCTKIQKVQKQSPYLDVHHSEAATIVPMVKLRPSQRHVEISAKNQYPNGLRHLLSVTNSVFITDDAFVTCLTDLNYSLMWLEECRLQHCHQMIVVFRINSKGSEALPSLQILQASYLKNLLSFIEPGDLSRSELITLKLLKDVHLEHCPRLEKIFPCSLLLPKLEALVILFCSNLKTIFYKQPGYAVEPSPLPNIERIYLQELPQLRHIHEDVMFQFEMANWEKLFVRGCREFQHLPLLKNKCPESKVQVNGERDWWNKLQDLPEQSNYYLQELPPEFASLNKDATIKSYLV